MGYIEEIIEIHGVVFGERKNRVGVRPGDFNRRHLFIFSYGLERIEEVMVGINQRIESVSFCSPFNKSHVTIEVVELLVRLN